MTWAPPGVSQFKTFFNREFSYGDGQDKVMDSDITRALTGAGSYFNQSLILGGTDLQTQAYLYLAAHLLVLNIQAAGGLSARLRGLGVRNVSENIQISKGLGQANITMQAPPPYIAGSPLMSYLWRTGFGQAYMAQVYPQTAGPFMVAAGPNPNQFNAE